MASQAAHGTRTRYVRGCRCERCKSANREYSTRARNRARGLDDDDQGKVTAMRSGSGRPRLVVDGPDEDAQDGSEYEPGRCEAGVLRELEMMSAAQKQPGLAEGVLQMARLLDSPRLASTHASAMRQMTDGLSKLRSASAGRSSRLSVVALKSRREASAAESG